MISAISGSVSSSESSNNCLKLASLSHNTPRALWTYILVGFGEGVGICGHNFDGMLSIEGGV